jgi:carboxymethylenebutenolidase
MLWNQFKTDAPDSITAQIIEIQGHNGDTINAYFARPMGAGPFGGIVLVHHAPGWDEYYRETARRWAAHGYIVVCPNLYARAGHGTPDEVTAVIRNEGGVSDASVVGDCTSAMTYIKSLPASNGKVGITGTCSGGRHSYVVACTTQQFDAIIDCWGGGVAAGETNEKRPVLPITMTKDLNCPILGLFGNEDQGPSPEQVNMHEEELKKHGKNYEFHRYDGAGHGFTYYDRPNYRQQHNRDAPSFVVRSRSLSPSK